MREYRHIWSPSGQARLAGGSERGSMPLDGQDPAPGRAVVLEESGESVRHGGYPQGPCPYSKESQGWWKLGH